MTSEAARMDRISTSPLLELQRPHVHEESTGLGPWFHNLHLPDGSQTAPQHPLGDFPMVKWRQIAPFIATDLRGWRVLDIGCNAGFYSFELALRGADVTAIDIDPHYLRQARWAARQYGLEARIEFRQGSVYALAGTGEQYDLVWFLGVLYHLRHPLLALDILREITLKQMVLQTLTMPGESVMNPPASVGLNDRLRLTRRGWPHLAFIERALENDPTNWWAPNHACVEAMVRAAGFTVTARPGHEIYVCEPDSREPPMARHLREVELRALHIHAATPGERS
jgi:tRNA (mo5U34)-methyltransferase